jgi:hypothetical protein
MFTEGGTLMVLLLFVCCWTVVNDGIGDAGAIRIAEGLEKNTSLIRLRLEFDGVFLPYLLLHPVVLSH